MIENGKDMSLIFLQFTVSQLHNPNDSNFAPDAWERQGRDPEHVVGGLLHHRRLQPLRLRSHQGGGHRLLQGPGNRLCCKGNQGGLPLSGDYWYTVVEVFNSPLIIIIDNFSLG